MIGNKGARAIAGAPALSSLKSLRLRGNKISGAGAAALAASPHLRGLEHLDLTNNVIDSKTEEKLRQAKERRAEAARFESEIRERMTRLEREIADIRAQGQADGEAEKKALVARADQEAERVRRDSEAEIERRVASAREELTQAAADLIASTAREQVRREMTDEDRRRLLAESVARMEAGQ